MAATPGYQALIIAGASLIGTEILEAEGEPADDERERFLRINAEALDNARQALRQHCAVEMEYDAEFFGRHCGCYGPLRHLTCGFELELLAHQRAGNLTRVVDAGLTMFDLANAARRGGFVVDAQVALCVESMAIDRLRSIRSRLEPRDATRLANGVLARGEAREPISDVILRDRKLEEVVRTQEDPENVYQQVSQMDVDGVDDKELEAIAATLQAFVDLPRDEQNEVHAAQDYMEVALARLLAIELALFAFHAEQGSYPIAISALAPKYIGTIPRDPFSGGDFKYRLSGAGFLLYSVGPSGKDSGGNFGPWPYVECGEADLCLDVRDYQIACHVEPPEE